MAIPTFELTTAEVRRFRADGFLIVESLIDAALAARAAQRFDALFRGEFETGVQPDEVNWQSETGDETLTRQICNGWKADRDIARVVLREDLGRACAQLGGWSGARLMQDNVLWKPPRARPLGFHQDNSYLGWLHPPELLSCWIALDDTHADGGALELVRGSHRWPSAPMASRFHGPEDYRREMEAAARNQGIEPDIVSVVVPRGGGSFHHGALWHGSGHNRRPASRRALVVHACAAHARFDTERLSEGIGPIYGRYRRLNDDQMDENHFPVLWHEDGGRTAGIDAFLRPPASDDA